MVKILAIDDKQDNIISLSATLRHYIPECTMIAAQSGPEGIRKAEMESPDTILLDIKMPGMDGYEVCRQLKDNKNTRHIPVIMVSAILMGSIDLVKALETGADAYLTKPFDDLVLIAQVKSSLRMKKAEDSLREQKDLLEKMVQKRTASLVKTYEQLQRETEERKQAASLLKESEERFRLLYEKAPLAYQSLDKKGSILDVNQAWLDLMGFSRSRVVGRRFDNFLALHELEAYQRRFPRFIETGEVHVDLGMIHKSGSEIIVHIDGKIGYDQDRQFKQTHCILSDVTAQKKAEESLRESKEKFHSIVDNIGIGVALISPEMEVLELNKQMREWFPGIQLETPSICYRVFNRPSLDTACNNCPIPKTLQDGRVHDVVITKLIGKKHRNFRIVSSPIFNARGQVTAAIEMVDDITERLSMEAQLQQSQKLEAIGTLAGGIAHDFNNILSAIIGYTELALDEAPKGSILEEDLQEIFTGGKRAKDLVKQILTFARQSDEAKHPIRIDVVAKEVLKFMRSSIPTSIEIKSDIRSKSLVMGSPTQIHQILMNLCTNASQAMEGKGGLLALSLRDVVAGGIREDKSNGRAPETFIEIKVSDTGSGIPSEIMDKIFEPYFTTKPVEEGTGMGLAVVHGIIESYGGKIAVESSYGKGSVFIIHLPVTRQRVVHESSEPGDLPKGEECILFVDDEPTIAKIGKQILERLGYSVTVKTSSLEALELFRSNPDAFDLIISDMTMPQMTGDMLAVELMSIRPGIPVILCTGFSKTITDEITSEIGIKAFAYKPISKADLAKTVRKVLDEAKYSA